MLLFLILLFFSKTDGDVYRIDSGSPSTPVWIKNIGAGHAIGSHTNYYNGAAYSILPGLSRLLSNNVVVANLTAYGAAFHVDFSTFGFTIDPTGQAWYCGRRGDSNQNCLWSVNLSTAAMELYGCVDSGDVSRTVNGLHTILWEDPQELKPILTPDP